MKFISLAQGWKTYCLCAVAVGVGVAEYFGWHPPGWADWIMAGAGGATMRAAITRQALKSAGDIAELVKLVLPAITTVDVNADTTGATIKVQPAVEVHELPPIGK